MTKLEALEKTKMSKTQLAKALEITKQAINNWPDDQPIPELQELKIIHKILPGLEDPKAA